MDMRQVMLRQLAVDFNTTPHTLAGGENQFTKKVAHPDKRPYENGPALLQILCAGNTAVFNAADDTLLEALRRDYGDYDAAWLFEMGSLRHLEELLRPFGQKIDSFHQYYVPRNTWPAPILPDGCRPVWYEGDALAPFVGDQRFDEALGGNPQWPDRLAVTAEENGEILGMAGASSDSAAMWQIGINVCPGHEGQGLGAALTALLKDELLRRGLLPFYGTACSHVISQRVAVQAGFLPAWAELYTKAL